MYVSFLLLFILFYVQIINVLIRFALTKIYAVERHLAYVSSYLMKSLIFQSINKELLKLDKLIERANEKGWRKEYPLVLLMHVTNSYDASY